MQTHQETVSGLWKFLLLVVGCALLLVTKPVFAHTGLEVSSPQDQQVVEEVKEIVLEFHTKIEQMSTFTLVNEKGENIEIGNIVVADNTMKAPVPQVLQDGGYMVNWKIVGEDGHPVEGKFSFTVKAPAEKSEQPDQSTTNQPANGQSANDQPAPQVNNPASTNEGGNASAAPETVREQPSTESAANTNTGFIAVAALVALVIICALFLMRKKGK